MRKFVLTMTALLLSASSASAAVTELNIEKDLSDNLIEISGKALPNESVSFQILPENVSLVDFAQSESKNDIIAFVREAKADEKGIFEVNVVLEDSGDYKLYVASSDISVPAISKDIDFYDSDVYAEKISLVNAAKAGFGEVGFVNTAKDAENIAVLGFNESINDIVPVEDILKFMYKELSEKSLDADKYLENVYLYRNSYVVIALNRRVLTDIDTYVKNIISEDATLKKYWEQYITSNEIESFLINKISGKSISDINDLKVKLKEGLILAATKYPNGYMSLMDLYSDYKNIIGLSSVSSKSSVYSSVGGKEYADVEKLKEAYEQSLGNGGGYNEGGGDKVSGGGNLPSFVINNDGNNNIIPPTQPIGIKFLDLDSYEWAYPSIARLFDAGIINGISDEQFAPRKAVKREEFVKMIVCAKNLEMSSGDTFKDVDNSAWYAPYVYSAHQNGIINGIGYSEFGVSKNITRQDMAVIIYNAIKLSVNKETKSEITFSDSEDISDYAKEAVEILTSLGIINGTDDGRFAPKDEATRAQAAVIIERALQYLR